MGHPARRGRACRPCAISSCSEVRWSKATVSAPTDNGIQPVPQTKRCQAHRGCSVSVRSGSVRGFQPLPLSAVAVAAAAAAATAAADTNAAGITSYADICGSRHVNARGPSPPSTCNFQFGGCPNDSGVVFATQRNQLCHHGAHGIVCNNTRR